MSRELYGYQKTATQKFLRQPRLPLFWEMRLGKSFTALTWVRNYNPKPQRVLIVCPKSVIISWEAELKKDNQNYLVFTNQNRELQELTATFPLWAITNYENVTADESIIKNLVWDAVLCDESHRLKNPTTKIASVFTDEASFPLASDDYPYRSPMVHQLRAILTGTPAEESYLDYFNQFKFLYGKMGPFDNFFAYRKRLFRTSPETPGKYLPTPEGIRAIANYLDKYASRLSRKQVGIDLPNVVEDRYVELSPDARKIYDEFERNWYSDFMMKMIKEYNPSGEGPSISQLATQFAFVAQNILYQFACGYPKHEAAKYYPGDHKLKEVHSILENELKKEKVVIWCRHLAEIDKLEQTIPNSIAISGSVSLEGRKQKLEQWRNSTDHNVLICQIRSMGTGMDLSVSDTQIFFSKEWSVTANNQASERLIHPEKRNKPDFASLLTINIITEGTVDVDLHEAILEKKVQSNAYKFFLKRTRLDVAKQLNNL